MEVGGQLLLSPGTIVGCFENMAGFGFFELIILSRSPLPNNNREAILMKRCEYINAALSHYYIEKRLLLPVRRINHFSHLSARTKLSPRPTLENNILNGRAHPCVPSNL